MAYMEIRGVRKTFDGEHYVLQDINVDIEKGELVTLLGPSGCGKSTLLRSIAGFLELNGGEIIVEGQDITNLAPKDRKVGMVFQQYSLFPTMNVEDNIAFGLKMKKMDRKEIKQRVEDMIKMVGLEGRERYFPTELSGGQKQRVALARALVTEPQVLLLDEPLSAIDAKLRKSLQRSIREIQRKLNITTVFVTHDQDEAMIMSDKILLMNQGKIEQVGNPVELYTNPKTQFAASFIGNYNVFSPQEFHDLFNKRINYTVALRPEAISVNREGSMGIPEVDNMFLKGTIKDMTPRGNILSYDVDVNGVIVKADNLFRTRSLFEPGDEVLLSFEERNCLEVQSHAAV